MLKTRKIGKLTVGVISFAIFSSSLWNTSYVNAATTDSMKIYQKKIDERIVKMDKSIDLLKNEHVIYQNRISELQQAMKDNKRKIVDINKRIEVTQLDIKQLEHELQERQQNSVKQQVLDQHSLLTLPNIQEDDETNRNPQNYNTFPSYYSEMTEILNQINIKIDEMKQIQEAKTSKLAELEELQNELIGIKETLRQQIEQNTRVNEDNINEIKHNEEIKNALVYEKKRAQSLAMSHELMLLPSISNTNLTFVNGVPSQYLPIYKAAEKKYGVEWYYLAAIHAIETSFSTDPIMRSSVGAIGPFQFMPSTWTGERYNIGGGLVSDDLDMTNLEIIKLGGGYGQDGDGDGKADPWNLADAAFSAAKYLADNGISTNPEKALWHYNHADWYVRKVMTLAEKFKKDGREYTPDSLYSGTDITTVGYRWIGNSVYVFGGGRNPEDIKQGRFDCSSFVHWAYSQVGIHLGESTSVTTDTLKNIGTEVSLNEIRPGDLVFFDTYKKDGHVGIYIGKGQFIGAQSSSGVAIANMTKGYWKDRFNGRIKRIQ